MIELKLCLTIFVILMGTGGGTSVHEFPKPYRNNTESNVYNGIKVTQPYNWMELKENQSNVSSLIQQQAKITQDYAANCTHRQQINKLLEKYTTLTQYRGIEKFGDKYLYIAAELGESKYNFYIQDDKDSAPRKPHFPLTYGSVLSPDASLVATFNEAKTELSVYNITSGHGANLVSKINMTGRTSVAGFKWDPSGSGLFYVSCNIVGGGDSINFHKLGDKLENELDLEREAFIFTRNNSLCDPVNGTSCSLCDPIWGTLGFEITDSGKYLLARGQTSQGQLLTVSLIEINQTSILNSPVVMVKSGVPEGSFSLIANNGTTFYFKTSQTKLEEAELKGGKLTWKTVKELDGIGQVVAFGDGKIFVELTLRGDYSSVYHVMDLVTGATDYVFPITPMQDLTLRGKLGDPEVLITSHTFNWLTSEMYSFRLDTGLTVFKGRPFKSELTVMHYPSSLPGNETKEVLIWVKEVNKVGDIIVPQKAPTFIMVDGNQDITTTHLAVLEGFGGALVMRWGLKIPQQKQQPFFSEWIQMDKSVVNLIDIAEALIKQGYSSSDQLYMIGSATYATMATLAVNRRPDLFAGLIIADTTDNFKPEVDAMRTNICPDNGSEYYGEYCKKVTSAIFPLLEKVSPLLSLNSIGLPITKPTIVVKFHREMRKKGEYFGKEIYGLQYLAEWQNLGNSITERPSLLLLSEGDEQQKRGKTTNWEDILCILEKSNGLVLKH